MWMKMNDLATSDQIADEFQPYVHVVTERAYPPLGQVHLAMFSASLKLLRLPADVVATTLPEQVEYVRQIAARHTVKYRGRIPPFGEILGYALCCTPEDAVMLDPQGNVMNWFGRVSAEAKIFICEK